MITWSDCGYRVYPRYQDKNVSTQARRIHANYQLTARAGAQGEWMCPLRLSEFEGRQVWLWRCRRVEITRRFGRAYGVQSLRNLIGSDENDGKIVEDHAQNILRNRNNRGLQKNMRIGRETHMHYSSIMVYILDMICLDVIEIQPDLQHALGNPASYQCFSCRMRYAEEGKMAQNSINVTQVVSRGNPSIIRSSI